MKRSDYLRAVGWLMIISVLGCWGYLAWSLEGPDFFVALALFMLIWIDRLLARAFKA